jgi:release factor glutamine methyltransferase
MHKMDTPRTLAALAKFAEQTLMPRYPDTAAADARYILKQRTGHDWSTIIADPEAIVTEEVRRAVASDLAACLSGIPLSRLYGVREFYGLEFELSPATLDPRPDTEVLVNLALRKLEGIKSPRILDLGTGSGCVLISILASLPEASGVGIDLSPEAVSTAGKNARRHNLEERALFLCGSWAESIKGTFDLVVSNPPYISNQALESLAYEVLNHDPILALAGGKDGLQAYREIFIHLPRLLEKGAFALLEIGFDQGQSIVRLSEESRFSDCRVHLDSGGLPRVAEIKI